MPNDPCDPQLSAILDSHECPAAIIDEGARILAANEAYRLRFASGQNVCGLTCHEVSHDSDRPCFLDGEQCPRKIAQQVGRSHRVVHLHQTASGVERHEVIAHPICSSDGSTRIFLELIRPCSIAEFELSERTILGDSQPIRELLAQIRRVATSDAAALLLGETGTGKELAAETLHHLSDRRDRPLVPVDCAGLPETLIESELFGHEKGAFTGAHTRKHGLIHAARGGTLFLDEVGDMPLSLQSKLLRVIETGVYRRVGGLESLRGDFRLIVATSRDLRQMVERGKFRADLYYRIATFPIVVPPLRERLEDLPILAQALLQRISPARNLSLAPETLQVLCGFSFPGNVRELKNILERGSLLAETNTILPNHLPRYVLTKAACPSATSAPREIRPLNQIIDDYLCWAASVHQGSKRQLARELGMSERSLYRRLGALRGQS
jgi:transcriptional regulator with GAF, ATPase, and Fis domain